MAEHKSLADILGVPDPLEPDRPQLPETAPEMSARDFCTQVLNSKEYREALLRRILMGDLPSSVECKMMDYAWGRPIERVQVQDTTQRLEDLSVSQLEERALFLADVARRMRTNEDDLSADEDPPNVAVH